MEPTITPIDASFGAVVTDIDLADLDDATEQILQTAFLDYAMLVFPGQNLTEDAQTAFANRFGEIEHLVVGTDMKSVPLSNQNPDGSVLEPQEHFYQVLRGNEGWHTDSSYMPLAAKASVLSAHVVPPAGGETEWADMRAAWDELEPEEQDRVAGLSAYHSLYRSQSDAGFSIKTGAGYGYHTKGAPLRSLVKTHPETGRKALFIGRHAYDIPGMSEAESKQTLTGLLTAAVQPPRTYSHTWAPGDIILWDNRCLLHRARPYDVSQPRVMLHTRISGDPASELAPTSADTLADEFIPKASNY